MRRGTGTTRGSWALPRYLRRGPCIDRGQATLRPERPLALFALEKVYAGQGNTAQAQATGDKARRLWQEMGADAVSS